MKHHKRGEVLIFFLAIMSIGLLLVTALLSLQDASLRTVKKHSNQVRANYLAEAGIDQGLEQLATNSSYTGETLIFSYDELVIAVEPNDDGTKRLFTTATVGQSIGKYQAIVKADNSLQFGSFSAY